MRQKMLTIIGVRFSNDLKYYMNSKFNDELFEIRKLLTMWVKTGMIPLSFKIRNSIPNYVLYSLLPNQPDRMIEESHNAWFQFTWNKKLEYVEKCQIAIDKIVVLESPTWNVYLRPCKWHVVKKKYWFTYFETNIHSIILKVKILKFKVQN